MVTSKARKDINPSRVFVHLCGTVFVRLIEARVSNGVGWILQVIATAPCASSVLRGTEARRVKGARTHKNGIGWKECAMSGR